MLRYKWRQAIIIPALAAVALSAVWGTTTTLSKTFSESERDSARVMPVVELGIAGHDITAEVAKTARDRGIGLMHRKALANNHGMLFIQDEPGRHCFWMKNTHIPLTIAFLDEAGTIQQLADMNPMTRTAHCSKEPSWQALEMSQGWFDERGIGVGDQVTGTPAN